MPNSFSYDNILLVAEQKSRQTKQKLRLRGQAVKTSPFHGGNTGSIPVGVIWRRSQVVRQWSATPVSTGSNPVDASIFPETDGFRDFSFFKNQVSKRADETIRSAALSPDILFFKYHPFLKRIFYLRNSQSFLTSLVVFALPCSFLSFPDIVWSFYFSPFYPDTIT